MRFSVGINYWPRRSAMAMWRRFDAGEIREDFARIAAFGLDAVRFFLRWDDFQPHADTMDPEMLARLEAVVDIAAEAGLRTVPTLFCGHMSGVNWLPAWTLDPETPHGRFRTIVGGAESPYGIGDFYTGPLLDAQLLFARAVGERLHAHPAVYAWDLGNEFSNLREPHDEYEAAEWSRRLTRALEETSGIPVTAGTHGEDLTRERHIRLASLCAPYAFATMHGYPVYSGFSRSRLDPEVVPFLAYLAAGFSHKPVLFSEFGNPTCPPGKRSPFERVALPDEPPNPTISPNDPIYASYACLTEYEMAEYCGEVLDRLHADGRLGGYWWCWADYADELRNEAPFDRAPHELSFGIVRSDGSEKPVAVALAAFARERRTVLQPHDIPVIADTYYYRTLPDSTKTLFGAFLRSVEERRGGAG
ncbi:MAG: putative Beta-galactosidase [Candidatus Eremiobacteraeota bacterium]|nr:putative Beta-galactosidase [Candidatus Eremiobacteraeota bacterium]